jgi:hypothetical protein
MDWEDIEIALYGLSQVHDEDEVWSDDVMDVVDPLPYTEGPEFDNVPAVLERNLREGFSG